MTQIPKNKIKLNEPEYNLTQRHRVYGWTALLVWLAFGFTLEVLLGFKAVSLLLDPLRREFWSLAHFHGALLSILNIIYVGWSDTADLNSTQRRLASQALIGGSILLPLGFFLGGIVHYESDPGVGIFLVPVGAILILYAIALQALAAWRRN